MSNTTNIRQKEQKETTKEGGLSSTIMDQKSIYNSTHLIMVIINIECAMKQEFLNCWNPEF